VPTPGIGIVAASEAAATRAGTQGVVIVRTAPGSSAERAGLRGIDPRTGKPGDIIVGINGKPVRGMADLIQELERVGVGKRVTVTVQRDGREVHYRLIDGVAEVLAAADRVLAVAGETVGACPRYGTGTPAKESA
jgi:2-alkenal reductase